MVLDEHEEAHQSEQSPTWSARDVAIGYLCKPCDPERVGAAVSVVERVINGESTGPDVPGFVLFPEGVANFHARMREPATAASSAVT